MKRHKNESDLSVKKEAAMHDSLSSGGVYFGRAVAAMSALFALAYLLQTL